MLGFSQDGEDSCADTACLGAGPGNLVCVDGLGGICVCGERFDEALIAYGGRERRFGGRLK